MGLHLRFISLCELQKCCYGKEMLMR
jgi:hypothetical protein